MRKPASRVEALLRELCERYGYCLPEEKEEVRLADVPEDPDAFVDGVLIAEGLYPTLTDKAVREELREVVCDWLFDDGQGRGTKSDLPRLPLEA